MSKDEVQEIVAADKQQLQEDLDRLEKCFEDLTAEEVEAFHDEADSFHYVVFPSCDLDGVWICHCLELDIIGQSRVGKGPADALTHTLDMAYATLLILQKEGKDPHDHEAPPQWWPSELLAEHERRRQQGLKIINAMAQPPKDPKTGLVRLRYSKEEMGWAEDLGNGHYKLANAPLTEGLHSGDIVTISDDGELVIVSRTRPNRLNLDYTDIETFNELSSRCRQPQIKEYCTLEGYWRPKDGQPGHVVLTYDDEIDVDDLLADLDVNSVYRRDYVGSPKGHDE